MGPGDLPRKYPEGRGKMVYGEAPAPVHAHRYEVLAEMNFFLALTCLAPT